MEREQQGKPEGRRNFLKLASVGAVAGTLAAASGRQREAEAAEPEARAKGYRETDHVRKFYELARF
jgi:hypothetical protein